MALIVERRQLVLPGDLLAEGGYQPGENTYKKGDRLYAQKVGLVEVEESNVAVVPLRGCYVPKPGDQVIGEVMDISLGGWIIDINSPYNAILSIPEVTGKSFGPKLERMLDILDVGEVIVGKVAAFDRTRDPSLTVQEEGLGKVERGLIIDLQPPKIPRLIGRKGSMVNMIMSETGCEIVIGQNGKVLLQGTPRSVEIAIKAINMIEREAHISGLTERVKGMLQEEKSKGE